MIARKRVRGYLNTLVDKAVRLWWAGAICLVLAVASILLVRYHAMPLWAAVTGEDDELVGNAAAQEEFDWIVYWETNDRPGDNIAIDLDPHPASNPDNPKKSWNGGPMRIFPGKITYDDQYAPLRRYVLAVAEWTLGDPPPEMYFRLWDVDDPSADGPPIDTRPKVEPGANGPDNWVPNEDDPVDQHKIASESDATKHFTVAVPRGYVIRFKEDGSWEKLPIGGDNADCFYKVEVKVGMQPGDNYRFTASPELPNLLEPKYTQENADKAQLPANGRISKKLTVWRKLHVEIDSMPTEPNEWPAKDPDCKTCIVESVTVGSPRAGESTIDTYGAIGSPEVDHYEGGNIWKTTGPRWPIMKNTANLFDGDQIIIMGTPTEAEINRLVDQVCDIADDDPLEVSQLPLFPGVGPVATSRVGKAYIEPVAVDDNENTNKIVPEFYLNLGYWDIVLYSDWTARDLPDSQEDYWVAYVVMGYQGESIDPLPLPPLPRPHKDLDPDGHANFWPPMPFYSVAYEVGLFGVEYSYYAAVFVETSRDAAAKSVSPVEWPSVDEIMTHEIGHMGGAPDRETSIMDASQGMKTPDWFDEEDIKTFRENPYFKSIGE